MNGNVRNRGNLNNSRSNRKTKGSVQPLIIAPPTIKSVEEKNYQKIRLKMAEMDEESTDNTAISSGTDANHINQDGFQESPAADNNEGRKQEPITYHNDEESIGFQNEEKPIVFHNEDDSEVFQNEEESPGFENEEESPGFENEEESAGFENEEGSAGFEHEEESPGFEHEEESPGFENEEESAGLEIEEESAGLEIEEESPGFENEEESHGFEKGEESTGLEIEEESAGFQNEEESAGFEKGEESTGFENEEESPGFEHEEESPGFENEEESTGFEIEEESAGFEKGEESTGFENEEEFPGLEIEKESAGFEKGEESTGFENEEESAGFQNEEESPGIENEEESPRFQNEEESSNLPEVYYDQDFHEPEEFDYESSSEPIKLATAAYRGMNKPYERTKVRLPLHLADVELEIDIFNTISLSRPISNVSNIECSLHSIDAEVLLPSANLFTKGILLLTMDYANPDESGTMHSLKINIPWKKIIHVKWLHKPELSSKNSKEYMFASLSGMEAGFTREYKENLVEKVDFSLTNLHCVWNEQFIDPDKILFQGTARMKMDLFQKQCVDLQKLLLQ
ncbi:hypothetical protein [Mesobacillus jeotgali]|uniref:hypothetical protein n=1 Tax=Mesobacillus jeotgali TaxID=129985 RepID=UPI0009A5E037|nr:hypothetical protein [Mesobacillus jeotgali]